MSSDGVGHVNKVVKYPGNPRVDFNFHTCWTEFSRFGVDFFLGEICLLPSVFTWDSGAKLELSQTSWIFTYTSTFLCELPKKMPNCCSWGIKSISFSDSPGGWKPFCFSGRVFLHKTDFFQPNLVQKPETITTTLSQTMRGQSLKISVFVFVGLRFMKPTFDLLKVGFLSPNLLFFFVPFSMGKDQISYEAKTAFVRVVVFWWKYWPCY